MASRRRRSGTGKIVGGFVAIPNTMAKSDAWRTLQGSSVKVYVELASRFIGSNNGDLTLSMDEAKRLLGLGKATVARAFAELEEKGFIKMKKRGQWFGRQATEWALTSKGVGTHPATNEWKAWRSPTPLRPAKPIDPKNTFSVPWRNDEAADGSATGPRG